MKARLLRHGWGLPVLPAMLFAGLFYLRNAPEDEVRHRTPQASEGETLAEIAELGNLKRIKRATYQGPGGQQVTLPMKTPAVVHVWLEACEDCMPRFRAVQTLGFQGIELPQPVVNVAYQRATPAWAKRFGVDQRLVIDTSGGKIVNPLGIRTFTTLVIDPQGVVRLFAYPEKEGYVDRVRLAFKEAASPIPGTKPPPEEAEPAPKSKRRARSVRDGPDLSDPTLHAALLCLLLAVVWRLTLGSPSREPGEDPDDREAWVLALASSGQRCSQCGGRFTEEDEAVRCGGCLTAYHLPCGEKAEVCSTLGCPQFGARIA